MERLRNAVNAGRVKNPKQLRAALRTSLVELLAPIAKPLQMPAFVKPFILFFAGVNAVGKTTTIGKLAARPKGEGKLLPHFGRDAGSGRAVKVVYTTTAPDNQ